MTVNFARPRIQGIPVRCNVCSKVLCLGEKYFESEQSCGPCDKAGRNFGSGDGTAVIRRSSFDGRKRAEGENSAVQDFLFGHRLSLTHVRWVSIEGTRCSASDNLMLLRVAIKYQLHPLAVEDTLKMVIAKRPKVEMYGDHCAFMSVFGDVVCGKYFPHPLFLVLWGGSIYANTFA